MINGCPQSMGDGFMAVEPVWEITPERTRATLDISRAYPDEAGASSWQRTMSLTRGGSALRAPVGNSRVRARQ